MKENWDDEVEEEMKEQREELVVEPEGQPQQSGEKREIPLAEPGGEEGEGEGETSEEESSESESEEDLTLYEKAERRILVCVFQSLSLPSHFLPYLLPGDVFIFHFDFSVNSKKLTVETVGTEAEE